MIRRTVLSLILVLFMISCADQSKHNQQEEVFTNPILAGFYPDPSICKVGEDYYLVNSTFSYFPGIPIFNSKDLVHWELIGHVMNRMEQMDLEGLGVSRGIFAPAINYHDGLFYVSCTLVDAGGNFVVTSSKPEGPYSNPVWIPQINGIDPSMFFDDNGEVYILYNSIPPGDKPLYSGHRTIRMYRFDLKEMRVIGDEMILVNGGTDISKKPIWIEGPHIFKKDGFYYLIAAEGGTGYDHSEVVFRSINVSGPYESYKNNPILTQRNLDPNRKNPITSTGHADFVKTDSGDWWAIFLGCRPYEAGHYNTGRETFLAPVKWIKEWPVVDPGHEEILYRYPMPLKTDYTVSRAYSGNFVFRDNFDKPDLNPSWIFLRTPKEKWFNIDVIKKSIEIELRPEICSGKKNPSFLGFRQQHLKGSAVISMDFNAENNFEKAGLLVFQNENYFYFMCLSSDSRAKVVQLYKSKGSDKLKDEMELLSEKNIEETDNQHILLKVEADESLYSFYYGYSPDIWYPLKENVDAKFLSTETAGGFVGVVYALHATSMGHESENSVIYNWFEYKGNDDIYR